MKQTTITDTTDKKDPFFSKTNIEHVIKSVQELRENKGTIHELIEEDVKEVNSIYKK